MEIRRFPFSYDEGWSLRRTPGDSANYGEQGSRILCKAKMMFDKMYLAGAGEARAGL